MPKYIGPFDTVEIDGKRYERGANVNVSKERIRQLRFHDNLHFETDDPEAILPPNVADQRLADAAPAERAAVAAEAAEPKAASKKD